ncbi:unnamed protein product, partial [Allacma fusca]
CDPGSLKGHHPC